MQPHEITVAHRHNSDRVDTERLEFIGLLVIARQVAVIACGSERARHAEENAFARSKHLADFYALRCAAVFDVRHKLDIDTARCGVM